MRESDKGYIEARQTETKNRPEREIRAQQNNLANCSATAAELRGRTSRFNYHPVGDRDVYTYIRAGSSDVVYRSIELRCVSAPLFMSEVAWDYN